ncbi:hypothetical protein NKJ72_14600 [Mesorhizobium sp. M0045]|uniref:hypothetical protein n=1 Tax=Mesorhizobium sp. M0045 TaxID=2956857 RepID=UPI00333C2220
MKYSIISAVDGRVDIPITRSQFEGISNSIDLVVKAIDAEELFLVCVYNYEDFERHLQETALKSMLYEMLDNTEFWAISSRTHQRLANFLSSCKAYLDQIGSLAGFFAADAPDAAENLKAFIHACYDGSFSYRLMEALRNHVQHRGFGVHGHTLGRTWTSKGDEIKHRAHYWTDPFISAARLVEDPKIKKAFVAEIAALDKIEINPHVRQYMRAIGEIQSKFRTEIAKAVRNAKQPMSWALSKIQEQSEGGGTFGAMAVHRDDEIIHSANAQSYGIPSITCPKSKERLAISPILNFVL